MVRPKDPVSERTILIHHIRPIDIADAVPIEDAIRRVLDFIGPRPLIGYFLEFDVAMLNKHVRPMLGIPLPNRQIEVSRLYLQVAPDESFIGEFGPVMVVHTGPGLSGLAWWWDDADAPS